jgi:cytochrome b
LLGVAAALVVFRLVWGFTGSTDARFANFVRSPLMVRIVLNVLGVIIQSVPTRETWCGRW